jgi:hypothetical protein
MLPPSHRTGAMAINPLSGSLLPHARLRFNPFPEHGYATAVASISIRMSG